MNLKYHSFPPFFTTYFVLKIKENEECVKTLKVRLCLHSNRDKYKDSVRNDFTNAHFHTIKFLLSIAVILKFRIGVLHIKSVYLQSGPIERNIYVRPPIEVNIE